VPGVKTNEQPGTRAVLRYHRSSATKVRQVLDLVRGVEVGRARETLATSEREAAGVVAKVLESAVANAVHNDGQVAEELYISACFADEGSTLKRWRPRARGRATRIRKRTCHITVIVSRLPEDRLERQRAARRAQGGQRERRVVESRRRADLAGRLGRRRAAREAAAEAAALEEEATEVLTDDRGDGSQPAEPTDTVTDATTDDTVADATTDDTVADATTDDTVADDTVTDAEGDEKGAQ